MAAGPHARSTRGRQARALPASPHGVRGRGNAGSPMEFWPEFLARSWGKEFVAGGVGGMAGVVTGYPFDTLRIRIQQPAAGELASRRTSAASLFRSILRSEGPAGFYRGMSAPLASIAFQNAMVFQAYAIFSNACDPNKKNEPPSYNRVALSGVGAGALQSFLLSPVELIKIRLQLQATDHRRRRLGNSDGPLSIAKQILQAEGPRGIYRGFSITILRDAPAHGIYFWTYEYARERMHPGCRKRGGESLGTMLVAGGLAGVASWVLCYPLDVVKSRIQAQSEPRRYNGIVDCLKKSVGEEGYSVLWRGLGAAVARAFVVNGAIFTVYELALRVNLVG
ncbi:Mitochondrial arginine transporter BAC2 [Platanthera zijinensis]|uniref:Mitochondrial arginine transporter BAC2 n=1 Tax=Platanthera zijinensis TaxID=2320716 RepID=A0AAP0GFE0_9ASPA